MIRKEKKTAFRLLIGIGAVLLIILIAVLILFGNELRSLMSLKKIDNYGMYQMTYYGDYGFDDFLEVGASNDADIETFVTKRLLKGLPIDLGVTGDGCTAFVVKNGMATFCSGEILILHMLHLYNSIPRLIMVMLRFPQSILPLPDIQRTICQMVHFLIVS